jgi:NTE family protein
MTTSGFARPENKVAILRRIPVLTSCTEDQLLLIAERTRLVEYKKGESVYRQGDVADAFYMVSSGRLRVIARDGSGPEQVLAVLHNGDSFGEISLLTGETHSASVEALNDALVLELEKKDFDDVINRIPSLVLYLSRILSRRLRTRELHPEFSEATIVALCGSAKAAGRTTFAVALGALLRAETGKEVVVVDCNAPDTGQGQWYAAGAVTGSLLGLSTEEMVQQATRPHALGFSVVAAHELMTPGSEQAIAPLLSLLTSRYEYVLLDLPLAFGPSTTKALTQSDRIFLLSGTERDDILRANALMEQLASTMPDWDTRLQLILNLRQEIGREALQAVKAAFKRPVVHTLPHLASASGPLTLERLTPLLARRDAGYVLAVRHIARELGGMLIGLALGSGAALGLAHIGVLKVIEREQIPIDLIAGSSIGSLVGGLWACGMSAAELEQMALGYKNPWNVHKLFLLDVGIPVFSILVGMAAGLMLTWIAGFWIGFLFGFLVTISFGIMLGPLSGGPIQGARLMEKLRTDFANKTFEDTRIPLKIIAANPMAREEVVFDSGPVADAVRASVSIPGIFKPVTHEGRVCLDGGVVNPVPISVLKRAGAHHVIAVNVFPTTVELVRHREQRRLRRLDHDVELASKSLLIRLLARARQEIVRSITPLVFDVIMRSMQAMEYQIAEVACREADLTLRPTLPEANWLEFFSPEKFIQRGEEVALQYLPELKRITRVRSVDNAEHAQ